jgi:hypothetical protein
MSNRIVASRMADRVDVVAWMPPAARRDGLVAAARGWLRQAVSTNGALPAGLRNDLGLPAVMPGYDAVLDFEARRVRV